MMINLVVVPIFLWSREMMVQSKIFLDDGHVQIQDGCHEEHPVKCIGLVYQLDPQI